MTLKSMTGFARATGFSAPYRWAWEVKAVNAKGLDLRLRLPPGFDAMEAEARARVTAHLSRGTLYLTLTATRDTTTPDIRINEKALANLVSALERVPLGSLRPASLDGLLSVKGMVEVAEVVDDEGALAAAHVHILAGLETALLGLVDMRVREGTSLAAVLRARMDSIAHLTQAAETHPGRQVDAIRAKLAQTIGLLTDVSPALDPVRLHQEALLLAAKADVREELDRLKAHVAAVRELLASAQPVGRKLDFLAQELGREANTLCAKSNDAVLSSIGMDLRIEIEQFREQIQNIE